MAPWRHQERDLTGPIEVDGLVVGPDAGKIPPARAYEVIGRGDNALVLQTRREVESPSIG